MADVRTDLKDMKGLSEKDRQTLAEAESLLGPEPETMGFTKNLFWGRFREEMVLPYPEVAADETARCDQLLAELEDYLRDEHPSIKIDQEEEIPTWVIERLFKMGALGCTVPTEYGGLGFGITSYNRVLEMIGKYCGSTAVVVSAHQSIGCKAIMLFGNEEQKKNWLPIVARENLSAFCLSESNAGCDAGGVETVCELSEDGTHYIINGEKKWSTSGALAAIFTVMCRQKLPNGKMGVTALVCTPDIEGVDIFQKNRSKCGIRGTWQARIKFTNVKVPVENLLHQEGKGLKVALTCLNYGRCTLSAGMTGGAKRAMDQGIKWAETRYQFGDPLNDKQLVRQRIAHMAALTYAMDAVLYMTTGMLDRHDEDIMVETAICKVFCSEMGWQVVNDAVQIMGGESYMTENEIDRIFRDSRINTIVEGSNDLMWSFIFGYGGKQLGEWMLGMKDNAKSSIFKPAFLGKAIPLGMEVFLGIRRKAPEISNVHPSLRPYADRVRKHISEFTYQFKQMSKKHDSAMLQRQCPQSRLALAAIQIHAWICTLSKLDRDIRNNNSGEEFARDKAAAIHFFDLAELEIEKQFREGYRNADDTMELAAEAAMKHNNSLPNSLFIIPEKSPEQFRGTGRTPRDEAVRKFPSDNAVHS
jgi:acyl-CoA dehydrogenase family protein 9